jgi:hypothetical protein
MEGASAPFRFEAFGRALGYRPWPYSPEGTYWNGGSRFLDWQNAERLIGLSHSELLLSEYDAIGARNRLYPFPTPKTVGDAIEAVISLGWVADSPAMRTAILRTYTASLSRGS